MCSPIGHSLMGSIIYVTFNGDRLSFKEHWKGYFLYIFVANLPDLDIVPGLFQGDINLYHHQITHTFFFAAMFTAGVYLFYRLKGRRVGLREIFPFFLLYLSHVVLDYFAVDTRPPYGEELFWPFSNNYYISPFTPFLDITRQKTLTSLFNIHNFVAVLREVEIFVPILVFILFYQLHARRYSRTVEL